MSELDGWERQLSDLLKTAAGEPQRPVSIEMVRRRLIRRRVAASAAAAAAAVLFGGLGAAVAATVTGHAPVSGTGAAPGVPSYYIQAGFGLPSPVVRSRTTGDVTAKVHCPWRGTNISVTSMAAASHRTFFVVCQKQTSKNTDTVAASRIYRFRLTGSGRISGYSPVPGGALPRLRVGSIAATSDGSEVAVTVTSGGGPFGSPGPANRAGSNTRSCPRTHRNTSPDYP